MVFSSIPVYLDPPNNWHQQQANHLAVTHETPQLRPPPPPPPPPPSGGSSSGSGGSIRPGSMADRARLANIPQPEASLKCPRCESINTKFCYFNNYSLAQPRHFCKTCRRYWTRGGALRNVPVGGGCRRNKKTKSHSNPSRSSVSSERQNIAINSSSISAIPSDITNHGLPPQPSHNQLPFFTQFSVGNIGLSFGGIQGNSGATNSGNSGQTEMGLFHIGSNNINNNNNSSINGGVHQFPFFEPMVATSLYPFHQNDQAVEASSSSMTSSSRVSQLAPLKMEDRSQHGLNLSKSFLGITENNNPYWSGTSWTDLSGHNSSI